MWIILITFCTIMSSSFHLYDCTEPLKTPNISKQLGDLFEKELKASKEDLAEIFDLSMTQDQLLTSWPNNCLKVAMNFSQDLRHLLKSRIDYLNEIKSDVTRRESQYEYQQTIPLFNYFNRRNMPKNAVEIVTQFSSSVPVNIDRSHVHVPTEIYDNHVDILNNVTMTEHLDVVFINNSKREPSLLWQYFCSESGIMRAFPGEK